MIPDKLPVIDPDNQEILLWVDDDQAREMIKSGKAVFLRTKKKIRGLELVARSTAGKAAPVKATSVRQRGTMGDSHNHDRRDNPEGVWTIDRLRRSTRKHFLQVVTDCLTHETDSWKSAA